MAVSQARSCHSPGPLTEYPWFRKVDRRLTTSLIALLWLSLTALKAYLYRKEAAAPAGGKLFLASLRFASFCSQMS